MGGKESKQFPISYDEASKRGEVSFLGLTSTFGAKFEDLVHHIQIYNSVKRSFYFDLNDIAVTDNEKRRLQDAFRRSSAANNNISKQVPDLFSVQHIE